MIEIEPRKVKDHGQFFDATGREFFQATAEGRRPDVRDRLRVIGTGLTREQARDAARTQYTHAWHALAHGAAARVTNESVQSG